MEDLWRITALWRRRFRARRLEWFAACARASSHCLPSAEDPASYRLKRSLWKGPEGYGVEFLHADSHAASAVDWARRNAPYDFVFIDGDHSAEGVRADWNDYGPMGRVVGFHDIADEVVGTLWREIKSAFPKTKEVINSNKGIGIVVR